jgi:site-specific DNA recombinase
VHFAKENVVLSRDSRSHEKFMHGIKVLIGQKLHRQSVGGGSEGSAPEGARGHVAIVCGAWLSQYGRRRWKKMIVPDPNLAAIIARMFERYATGNYSL